MPDIQIPVCERISDLRKEKRSMNKDTFSFVIYMIHACANHWNQKPSMVYKNMKRTNCIMGFLVPNYEVLHTQSTQYVITDIKDYFNVRGIIV